MPTILAYTSPALGHLLPMSALLAELRHRGHSIYIRTLSSGLAHAAQLGFSVDPVDPRIEEIELDDWRAPNPRAALKRGVAAFGRRAGYEVADLAGAIAAARPHALLIDINCWGAQSHAEAAGMPWASFGPYTPPLTAPGVPPFGLGLIPRTDAVGRLRDAMVRAAVIHPLERSMVAPINRVRTSIDLPPVWSMDEFLRRSPLLLVASGKPFEYPHSDWGDTVQLIGPCVLDPTPDQTPEWLAAVDRPIVLVATSSEHQNDTALVSTALAALADDPVHVVATVPAGRPAAFSQTANSTVTQFVPHGLVLDRAICAVTHGGMGATQKALAHGVPVCVVPFGRDQFEVARRVEVAGCGTRLPAKKLTPRRLRDKVRQAMRLTEGARRVAAGFETTGGVSRGADLFEQRVLS